MKEYGPIAPSVAAQVWPQARGQSPVHPPSRSSLADLQRGPAIRELPSVAIGVRVENRVSPERFSWFSPPRFAPHPAKKRYCTSVTARLA